MHLGCSEPFEQLAHHHHAAIRRFRSRVLLPLCAGKNDCKERTNSSTGAPNHDLHLLADLGGEGLRVVGQRVGVVRLDGDFEHRDVGCGCGRSE